MKVRILVEQRAHPGQARGHLASGRVYDLDNQWAKELLEIGVAEPIAEPPAKRSEKRPGPTKPTSEKR